MKKRTTTLIWILVSFLFGSEVKAEDTIQILPPVLGMEESFSVVCKRFASVKCKEITYISTLSASNGFTPISSKEVGPDTISIISTEVIKNGLPKITLATNFWVKKELVSMDEVTILATSNIGTVTVQPKPIKPEISFSEKPVNKGKVYASLNITLNVVGKLQAYAVFNHTDTLNSIPRKSWYLDPNVKSWKDSSFQSMVDVWIKYQLTDTIKPELTSSTYWIYVPVKTEEEEDTIEVKEEKLEITSFGVKSQNGGDIEFEIGYKIPKDAVATAILDYDTDSNFIFPKEWRNLSSLVLNGNQTVLFTNISAGLLWARVQINDGNSLVSKKIPFQVWALGTKESEIAKISVYPNPCNNVLNAPSTGPWIIYNSTGQVIQKGSDSVIDVVSFQPGIYTIKTELGTARFVKN